MHELLNLANLFLNTTEQFKVFQLNNIQKTKENKIIPQFCSILTIIFQQSKTKGEKLCRPEKKTQQFFTIQFFVFNIKKKLQKNPKFNNFFFFIFLKIKVFIQFHRLIVCN